ncbi:MAG TPA: TonB family protein [Steroidobacteraceae bacterium]|jgi:protein TonB
MTADAPSLLPESTEGAAPVKDRLTTTLFLAALFHGIVILGVTFARPSAGPQPTPTLAVLLVTGPDTKAPDNPDAQYLAQRNQVGTGTTDKDVPPANPATSLLPLQQEGVADGTGTEYREAVAGQKSTEFISSRSDRSEVSYRSGENQPAAQAETPLALAPTAPSPIASTATDTTLRLRGRQDGKYEVIPNTRESVIAPYLDAWRHKVERLGTMNFPQVARSQPATGNPVLEVVIRSDGKLGAIVVRRSSGRKEIDQAALSILRLASPFDPFPADVRKKYDELRFAYEWQFLDGGTGVVSVPATAQ